MEHGCFAATSSSSKQYSKSDTRKERAMFQRIMVPLDGSERAERALPVAVRIARAGGANRAGTVLTLRVANPSASFGSPVAPTAELIKAEQEAALAYLREVSQRSELQGVSVSTAVKQETPVADALLAEAQASGCDLIVLCSHGRSGLERWALGSTVQKMLHHSPVPILVLHSGGPVPAHPHADAERPFCALVPLDGSALAESALDPAAKLVMALSAPASGALHLLQVIAPVHVDAIYGAQDGDRVVTDGDFHTAIQGDARGYLRTIAGRFKDGDLAALGLQVTWSVREDWDVATTICEVAESGEDVEGTGVEGTGVFGRCDLICMATHGRSGLLRWALGSMAERVLHAARLPLLVVPPHVAADSAQPPLARQTEAEDQIDTRA
jgi:nucleotide-binding universal stress UspA family protein